MSRPATGPFRQNTASTVTVAATTTSGSTRVALVGTGCDLCVQNVGSATAFIEFGDSTVSAATATGFPLLPSAVLVIGKNPSATHAAAITASGTATVYVTTGEGS